MSPKFPTKLSKYRGRQFYRFWVHITQSGLDREIWEKHAEVPVISHSSVEAVRLVQDELAPQLD